MLRLFRRPPKAAPGSRTSVATAPPPANPVEVGLLLRAARERSGRSLEEVRDATGVPRVDLDALEHGRLELLHVEQAAVVGLWRYAEHVGLDPSALVPVLRNHWPRPALAVDALHGELGGLGTPCARLDLAQGVLSRIASRGRELTAGSAPLGLSAGTRESLARGAAGAVLTVALIGPTGRQPVAAARKAVGARSVTRAGDVAGPAGDPRLPPPAAPSPGDPRPDGADREPAADKGRAAPRLADLEPGPGDARHVGPELHAAPQADQVPDAGPHADVDPAAPGGAAGQPDRGRRWPRQIAHTVAERFGLDEEPVAGRLWDVAATHPELVDDVAAEAEDADPRSPGDEPATGR